MASTAKPPLRIAEPGESAPAKKKTAPTKLVDAIDQSEREFLAATRAKLAAEIDAGVAPAYLAPITRQMRDIDREIRAIDLRSKEEGGDVGTAEDEAWDEAAL